MGLDTSAVCGVGRVFDSVKEVEEWFEMNFKGELTEREKEVVREDFRDFFESGERPGLPKLQCLNAYSGRGYAVYYGFGRDIKKLREAVEKALTDWEQNFKDEPNLLNEVSMW